MPKGDIDGDALWRAKQAKESHAKNVRRALWAIACVIVGVAILFLMVRCATA